MTSDKLPDLAATIDAEAVSSSLDRDLISRSTGAMLNDDDLDNLCDAVLSGLADAYGAPGATRLERRSL